MSETSDIIGYVYLKKAYYMPENEYWGWDIASNLTGWVEFYKNKYGNYQVRSGCLITLDKNLKKFYVLYEGNMVVGGKIKAFSKTYPENKESKIEKLKRRISERKYIEKEIKELLKKR